MPNEIYTHKLFAPPAYPGIVRRARILDTAFGSDALRVILLQGPAGHGKSTTLQQIKAVCEERGDRTGWLTFDEADNDTRRFLLHIDALVASLHDGRPQAEEPPGMALRRRSDWLIARLVQVGAPVSLFLDEFQVLSNASILAFFRELLGRLPEGIRIFIGSRSLPDVGLPRLLVNNQALVLRPENLRFSEDEVREFFDSFEQGISAEEISIIFRRTEGWPAALQLYRLALADPSVRRGLGDLSESHPRELADYLTDNVLALQRPELHDFLLKTSVLNRLCASLCDAVTGRDDAQSLLEELERAGLFLRSLDSELHWFKYHGLFASFLAEQLRARSPEAEAEVHRRAALWYREHLDFEEAVHHALACGGMEMAVDVLDEWSPLLVTGGFLITLERWSDRLPFEAIAARPSLALKVAWVLVFLRRWSKAEPLLALLRKWHAEGNAAPGADPRVLLSMAAIGRDDQGEAFELADPLTDAEPDVDGFEAFELGAAKNLLAYRELTFGELEAANRHLALAHMYNERGDATFSRGYTVALKGTLLLARGELYAALDVFRRGLAEERMRAAKSFASGAIIGCYIWALYEANRLDTAEALFGQYSDIISEGVLLDFLGVAFLAMVRTCDARGQSARALELLDEAEALGHVNHWHRWVRMVGWERVRRALLSGDAEGAQRIAAQIPEAEGIPSRDWVMFSEDTDGEAIGSIRLAIHTMNLEAAAKQLAREYSRHRGRVLRQIKLHLLEAQLHFRKDASNAANRCLHKALQLAAPAGFVRCFLDEGEGVLRLLREEYQRLLECQAADTPYDVDRRFLESLLQASGTDLSRAPLPVQDKLPEPLTDREKEILMFLAAGMSNKEVARRVFVTENTVKFHLKNIYAKLGVSNRLQAIAAARQRGLIH